MYIPSVDGSIGEEEWRPFVESHAFGHLIAAGGGRAVPVVVPTQFVLDGDRVLLHLAGPNPRLRCPRRAAPSRAERRWRLGVHSICMEGNRRRGSSARHTDHLLRSSSDRGSGDGGNSGEG